jgi:hypothetical protein
LVLPLAGAQLAFDVNLRTLAQETFGHAHQTVRLQHDAVPFGAFLALARGAVFPAFAGRDAQIGDAPAALERLDLWIGPQIPDQNDLVDAACHETLLSLEP